MSAEPRPLLKDGPPELTGATTMVVVTPEPLGPCTAAMLAAYAGRARAAPRSKAVSADERLFIRLMYHLARAGQWVRGAVFSKAKGPEGRALGMMLNY